MSVNGLKDCGLYLIKMTYKLVPISSRPGAHFAIDEEDHEKFVKNMPNWSMSGANNKYLQCDWKKCPIGRKRPRLHRLLMIGLCDDPNIVVDHINGDTLDNRRCNLRVITQSQNVAHRPNANINNNSGTRGVYWCKTSKRWIACIGHNDTYWWKKTFVDKEEAEREIKIKREEYNLIHGITTGNVPELIPELKESHEILDRHIQKNPNLVYKASRDTRERYNEYRREESAKKRREEREKLLNEPQTPDVIKRLKRLDADDKRAESRKTTV